MLRDHRHAISIALLALGIGCTADTPNGSPGEWVGSVTTEGDVTTVITESGSVWGGDAVLVEEASIGVAEGDEAYMLGRPGGVHASEEHIYVLDQQAQTVHAYDVEGLHLFSFGSPGQGPGELGGRPYSLGGADDGRVFVGDYGNRRINVYSAKGQFVTSYPMGNVRCCTRPMIVTTTGEAWVQINQYLEDDLFGFTSGMQQHDGSGAVGDITRPPELEVAAATIRFQGLDMPVRFSPELVWALTPDGSLVTGASHRYRFEVRRPSRQRLIVVATAEPIELLADEREWTRLHTVASARRSIAGWNWDGAEIPPTKPAFQAFIGSRSGEIWAVRAGRGIKDPECDDRHDPNDWSYHAENWRCWRDEQLVDVFDADGRYLGGIEMPEGIVLNSIAPPYIRNDTVIAAVYDPDGVIRVKRFRIAPPGLAR